VPCGLLRIPSPAAVRQLCDDTIPVRGRAIGSVRQGLDNLLGGWLAGAPDEVAGWTRRETGSYGFDMWSRAARAVMADYGQYGNPLRAWLL
jgi:hypothetical protein